MRFFAATVAKLTFFYSALTHHTMFYSLRIQLTHLLAQFAELAIFKANHTQFYNNSLQSTTNVFLAEIITMTSDVYLHFIHSHMKLKSNVTFNIP